MLQCN